MKSVEYSIYAFPPDLKHRNQVFAHCVRVLKLKVGESSNNLKSKRVLDWIRNNGDRTQVYCSRYSWQQSAKNNYHIRWQSCFDSDLPVVSFEDGEWIEKTLHFNRKGFLKAQNPAT